MEQFVAVPGARLRVRSEGDGMPVLIPTGAGLRFYENTFSAKFRSAVQRIYVEMRGTGESSGDLEGASFSTFADDLNEVRRLLGIERAVVLGHSNHACIALEYALSFPLTTAGAVCVAGCADFARAFTFGQERWAREAPEQAQSALAVALATQELTAPADPDEAMLRRYVAMAPLGWRDPEIDHDALWGEVPRGLGTYFDWLFDSGSQWDAVPRLRELRVPVLALSGRYDYLCPWELWGDVTAASMLRQEVFSASAHNPQYEEAEKFDDLVLGFVSAVVDRIRWG